MDYKDINTEHLYETYITLKFNYELHSKMMKYKQSGGNINNHEEIVIIIIFQ